MTPPLVTLFVAGTQRGGTTALSRLLRTEPGIRMARQKEPHFFDDESVDWSRPNYDRYHANFEAIPGEVYGEATPIYAYWPNALERIAAYNPHAVVVFCLRQPSMRAFSHWHMEMSRDQERMSFSEAIRERGRERVRSAPGGVHRVYSYVERGFYSKQVRRILEAFPRENVLLLRTDQLWSQPTAIMARIRRALHLPDIERDDIVIEYTPSAGGPYQGEIPIDDRKYLDDLFADDIAATAKEAGLDLSDWLDPNYYEPMRSRVEEAV